MRVRIIRGLPGSQKTGLAYRGEVGVFPVFSEHFFLPHRAQYLPTYDFQFQQQVIGSLERIHPEFTAQVTIEGILFNPVYLLESLHQLFKGNLELEVITTEIGDVSSAELAKRSSLNLTSRRVQQLRDDFVPIDSDTLRWMNPSGTGVKSLTHFTRNIITFSALPSVEKEMVRKRIADSWWQRGCLIQPA
jgi:hypothetical protein